MYVLIMGATFGQQHVSATKRWLDATGATSLAFDSSSPDYAAGWQPDLASPYMRLFGIDDREAAADYRSEIAERVNGVTARVAPRRLPRARSVLLSIPQRAIAALRKPGQDLAM
jgi:hypothetical protein